MRAIKYKAIESENGIQTGRFVYGYLRLDNCANAILSEWVDPNSYGKNGVLKEWIVDYKTICQSVNLKDSENKDIYEGDICINVNDSYVYVAWNKVQHRWSYYSLATNDIYCHLGEGQSEPTILGSIYKNSSLLSKV